MKKIVLSIFAFGVVTMSYAQVKTPQPSPASSVKQTIGLSEVTVDYSRPSAKERKIFGGLVSYDKVWRTGANGSTDITFTSEVSFGESGIMIPAGKYALYTVPSEGSWDIMLYKDTEQWGAPRDLDGDQIVASVQAKPQKTKEYTETFTIGFDEVKTDRANLSLAWENTKVEIPIVVDSKKEIIESIEQTLKSGNAKAGDYHQAASYYLSEGMNLKKALTWTKKANELSPDTFYMLKLQSEIEAANGDYKSAIKTAEKSLELATKAQNKDYVDMNNANITKWSKK